MVLFYRIFQQIILSNSVPSRRYTGGGERTVPVGRERNQMMAQTVLWPLSDLLVSATLRTGCPDNDNFL